MLTDGTSNTIPQIEGAVPATRVTVKGDAKFRAWTPLPCCRESGLVPLGRGDYGTMNAVRRGFYRQRHPELPGPHRKRQHPPRRTGVARVADIGA